MLQQDFFNVQFRCFIYTLITFYNKFYYYGFVICLVLLLILIISIVIMTIVFLGVILEYVTCNVICKVWEIWHMVLYCNSFLIFINILYITILAKPFHFCFELPQFEQ